MATQVEPLDFTKQSVSQTPTPKAGSPSSRAAPVAEAAPAQYAKVDVSGRAGKPSALSRLLGKSSTASSGYSSDLSPTDTQATPPDDQEADDHRTEAYDSVGKTLSRATSRLSGASRVSASARSRSSSVVQSPPGVGSGFVFGAGEIGNISSPRHSVTVPGREQINPGSVEARFIVNVPRTPSSQSMASNYGSTPTSTLGRSFGRLSVKGRSNSISQNGGLSRTPASSSFISIRRFIEKPWKNSPPDSPRGSIAGSVDSSVSGSGFAASPVPSIASQGLGTAFPMRGSTTGVGDELARRGSLSKSYGKLGKTLGEGAGGHVKIIKAPRDGRVFAVKEFRAKHSSESHRDYQKKVGGEYCLGMTLKHPNIVETVDIVYEPDRVFQIMEYVEFDLFAIVMSGKMAIEEVFCDFRQLMSGIRYLHSSGIAHRDLKLDNCVVSADGIVKIIDFGSSVIFRYPESEKIYDSHGVVGSDPYLAPEAATGDRYDPRGTDIWSAGVVLCCLIMRKFPWKAPRMSDGSFKTFVTIENGVHTGMDKLLANLPTEVHPLLRGMFDLDPVERWSIEQCWEDPWLSGSSFCTVVDGSVVHVPGHTHTTVPFEEAHIAMLEKKNKKAKKGEKMW